MVANEKWFGASADFYPETIDQSLRFNEGSNCRLSRIVGDGNGSGGGNRRTYTFSAWLKFSEAGDSFRIFEGYTSSTQYTGLGFDSSNRMRFDRLQDGVTNTVYSNAVFRDATHWGHFVWSIDTEQSTDTNRVRFYVNGTELTDKGTTGSGYPVEDLNTIINLSGQSTQHAIGKYGGNNNSNFSGYMAEVNFIDGQQLSPTSFGETKNGVWIPKSVSGLTYGTLGFRLTFADSSDLGNNANSTDGTNDFTTVSNLDSTDVVLDSPTNNYSTWNAINDFGIGNLTHGATKWAVTTSTNEGIDSTFAMPTTGKWYWEYHAQDKGYLSHIGLTSAGTNLNNTGENKGTRASWSFGTWHATYNGNNSKYTSTAGGSTGSTWSIGNVTDGQVLGCAYDADNGTLWFSRAGTFLDSSGTANPATNTDPRFSGLNDGTQWFAYNSQYASGSPDFFVNFGADSSFAGSKTSGSSNAQDDNGQGDFYYTPPSGFLALCASNLPDTTISPNQSTQADDHFNTVLWTGDDTTPRTITGVGFQPDWIWHKPRTDNIGYSRNHWAVDSSRGSGSNSLLTLYPNLSDPEFDNTGANGNLTAITSDGFTITGGTSTNKNRNNSGYKFVAWNWKAGGTTPTKTYKVVVVSDSGNKYRFRNSADSATFAQSAVTLDLQEGGTYVFDWSDSTAQGHPIRFSTTSDGTHGGGSAYTTGVVNDDSNYKTTITVANSAPTLYYYCANHSGMGGQINTNTTHGSTNFDGSILSVVQTNEDAGFSIIKYVGTGSALSYGHGLSERPTFYIVKDRDASNNWFIQYLDGSTEYYLYFTTASRTSLSNFTPDATKMNYGGSSTLINTSTRNYIVYAFHSVEGYSKIGTYVGNASTDGEFVFTGFRPAFVLLKSSSSSGDDWFIFDNKRETHNPIGNYHRANQFTAEQSSDVVDFLSCGFKFRATSGAVNDATTFVYLAFSDGQNFKFGNAR